MYQREEKNDFSASWISAPDCLLHRLDSPRPIEFPNAKFIWGRDYVRQHLGRKFTVNGAVARVFLHFFCDNAFDIFLNGVCIASDVRDHAAEVTAKQGENVLWLRTYQTDTPARFTAAIIGGVAIEYADGRRESIVTDDRL